MPDSARRPPPVRSAFHAFHAFPTRWADNDAFGHINASAYYGFFDTTITGWLIARGLLGIATGPMWMAAETGCRFYSEAAFPDVLSIGLAVVRLGSSAVTWELGVFRGAAETASAAGHFVHVHVSRQTRRPAPIPDAARTALAPLQR